MIPSNSRFTVYKITNTINSKVYVGVTSYELKKRWSSHRTTAKGSNPKTSLHKDMALYGIDKFSVEVLDSLIADDVRHANRIEREWIVKLNALRPNGYNIHGKLEFNKGDERCLKIGVPLQGLHHHAHLLSDERRAKINKALGTNF